MSQHGKYITIAILAVSLIMLVGGIAGSIYCVNRINERLDRAHSYRAVEGDVTSLGNYLGVSADIAIIGGLATLALVFKSRFRWGGAKGAALSILGASIIPMPVLAAICFGHVAGIAIAIGGLAALVLIQVSKRRPRLEGVGGSGCSLPSAFIILMLILGFVISSFLFGLIGAVIILVPLFYLVAVISLLGKRWIRKIIFILGGFLVLPGVFLTIYSYIWFILNRYDDFALMGGFFAIIGIGIAIVGMLISLGAIFWPRKKADDLEGTVQVPLSN